MNIQPSRTKDFVVGLVAVLAVTGCTAATEVGGSSFSLTGEATSAQAALASEITVFRSLSR